MSLMKELMKELEEHDKEVRTDERKKFAEWLNEQHHFIKPVEDLLAEYEECNKQHTGTEEIETR